METKKMIIRDVEVTLFKKEGFEHWLMTHRELDKILKDKRCKKELRVINKDLAKQNLRLEHCEDFPAMQLVPTEAKEEKEEHHEFPWDGIMMAHVKDVALDIKDLHQSLGAMIRMVELMIKKMK